MSGLLTDSGWDLGTFPPQAKRNPPLNRYTRVSCFGGLPLFSLFFDVVNSGRSRTSHCRGTHGLSLFQGKTTMNIFVGNLPFSATEADLKALFSEYGTVDSANIISDRETGQSRGFGFVELGADARAQDAIRDLDGSDLQGRNIKVNEAKPRT
jgi:RNA recognition motif-containing protein